MLRETAMEPSEQLFRIQRNAVQMMRDRGYIVPPDLVREALTYDAFMTRYSGETGVDRSVQLFSVFFLLFHFFFVQSEQLTMKFTHQTERHKTLVLFVKNSKVGKKEVEQLCSRMGEVCHFVLFLVSF